MSLHRDARRHAELPGHVVPHLGEERGTRALALLEGGDQAVLPLLPVRHVLGDLRLWILDLRPVAGIEHGQFESLQLPERLHVVGERTAVLTRADDRRALAEDQIATEAGEAVAVRGEKGEMLGRMTGSGQGGEPRDRLAISRARRLDAERLDSGEV